MPQEANSQAGKDMRRKHIKDEAYMHPVQHSVTSLATWSPSVWKA